VDLIRVKLISTAATHARSSVSIASKRRGSVGAMMRQTLGPRPPSCEGHCWWACGGLQQLKKKKKKKKTKKEMEKRTWSSAGRGGGGGAALLSSSYDDHSNYKPLGWRCKSRNRLLPRFIYKANVPSSIQP
ncbi:hypothetical protein ZWY2020_005984, partial [Hordeum vulgare]